MSYPGFPEPWECHVDELEGTWLPCLGDCGRMVEDLFCDDCLAASIEEEERLIAEDEQVRAAEEAKLAGEARVKPCE